MQKILIITDNPQLAKRFEKEVWPLVSNGNYNLLFCCSPYTLPELFDLDNEINQIDLKNKEDLNNILDYNLIISIHCKQLFPKILTKTVRCINVHPGYNPINRGWYPQVFAILNDLPIGATIHEIDEHLDHGPIIARDFVEKFEHDTSKTIYDRVVNKEIELLKDHIQSILDNNYKVIKPEEEGHLYLKNDFNDLCRLNLDEKITMRKAIDKLRALTHGNYKNAYYIDKNNTKIYVSINLENDEKA